MTTPILDRYIDHTPGVAGGKVRIAGRRITVTDIAIWYERLGRSADEISSEYDLTLAEVYTGQRSMKRCAPVTCSSKV